jgi:predicted transcriptional regulator
MNHDMALDDPWFDDYQRLKHQMIAIVSDSELAHVIEGSPTLGELCKEHGEVEQSYIDSFRTHRVRFDYRHPDPEVASSTTSLHEWYETLDEEFKAVLGGFTVEEVEIVVIDRQVWSVSIQENLSLYKEAIVIFAAKAWVHLLAIGKTLPDQWRQWIG